MGLFLLASIVVFRPEDYLDLSCCEHASLFDGVRQVWEVFSKLAVYLQFHLHSEMRGKVTGDAYIGNQVFVGEGTTIAPGACITGPAIIGKNCRIGCGVHLRENVVLGDDVMVGTACELKNSIVLDGAEIAHLNYVGDSLLGHKAHLGAGAVLSNFRFDHSPVTVFIGGGEKIATGLEKFGAVVGDHAQVGCNSVVSPGSFIGRNAWIYPCTSWRGVLPEGHIARSQEAASVIPNQKKKKEGLQDE